jgi:predicted Zn-dependent protease with MMP-like domain
LHGVRFTEGISLAALRLATLRSLRREAMDDRTFERCVRRAVEGLPEKFRNALHNIEIVIEDYADDDMLEELGLEHPILGLYQGIPLTERQHDDIELPDKISIFREELLDLGLDREELVEEIRITVLHEIGHYFGLDDETLEEIGY